jgi:hypothetical protein
LCRVRVHRRGLIAIWQDRTKYFIFF